MFAVLIYGLMLFLLEQMWHRTVLPEKESSVMPRVPLTWRFMPSSHSMFSQMMSLGSGGR